ncbi:hypothetical protein L1987_02837 [Smallanthus sonchifolius]|uniref:Uncharacterized protein n=1 Tax=Smallanthus sonchifolius TaxID=185202 RepID=A0ACB9K930_9ASTR|nr:hypothetical protein L1987_02837 [Smallanthus sonchifolius]
MFFAVETDNRMSPFPGTIRTSKTLNCGRPPLHETGIASIIYILVDDQGELAKNGVALTKIDPVLKCYKMLGCSVFSNLSDSVSGFLENFFGQWKQPRDNSCKNAEPTNRPVALKPNEEEKKLEWWVSSLEYLSKQQNVEERHTLQMRGIPKDGKVERILDLVQQLVSKQNNLEEGIKKRKFVEGQQHMDSVEGEEEEEEILDEDYAAAYGTPGSSVE